MAMAAMMKMWIRRFRELTLLLLIPGYMDHSIQLVQQYEDDHGLKLL
jgi:hypothetical protein